ncbi:MAG: PqqD family protein [Acidimicrobiales bacterium]
MARRRSDVIWRPVDGRVVGLDLATSRYFSLNGAGSALWELLEAEVSADEMVAALVARYGIDSAAARTDVDAFLADMRDSGLIEE